MKTLIYSDVHGNLPAFEAVLKDAGRCDQYICLGDLVNYGPWSNECVELALSLPNSVFLMGNHEEAFIQGSYPGNNPLVKSFFEKCHLGFNRINEIKSFINDYESNGFIFTHTIKKQYVYPDTNIELDNNYIIGHSHHQFSYFNNTFVLYNTGSVGQNRKYINLCNYILLDIDTKIFSLKETPYDLDMLINEMRVRGYSQECLDYYLKKERK